MRALPALLAACALAVSIRPGSAQSLDPQAFTGCRSVEAKAPHATAEDLERRCPGVEAALQRLGLTAQLPEGWRDRISDDGLRSVSALIQRYRGRPQSRAPDPAALGSIVAGLRTEPEVGPRSWWQRLKTRLLEWLRHADDSDSSWFERWLQRQAWLQHLKFSALAVRLIDWTLVLAVLAFAAWIVRRELVAAGVWAPLAARGEARAPTLPSAPELAPKLAQIDSVAPRDRPALLLRVLVGALTQSGRLRAERSLTHRELAERSTFDDAQQREQFGRLAALAERSLYAASAPEAGTEIEAAIGLGRQLYAQLLIRPAALA